MENSIENIWKSGFLNEQSLVVPKINNLYDQKSKLIVERINAMFKKNIDLLMGMSVAILVIYYLIGAVWQGVGIAVLMFAFALYNSWKRKRTEPISTDLNSYEYLVTFRQQMNDMIEENVPLMRVFYPLVMFGALSTVWLSFEKAGYVEGFFQANPDHLMVFGVPLIAWLIGGTILSLMAFFARTIYRWDFMLMYGRLMRKLDETIQDMEELRKS